MERIKKQMLSLLLSGEKLIWNLLDEQDSSLPEFFEILSEFVEEGLIKIEGDKAYLTEKGREFAEGLKYYEVRCRKCDGTGYGIIKDIENDYISITKNRPLPLPEYDQGYISPEGVLRRVSFMVERGDLYGKIFVAGDDDLFSIAASLTGLPEKISVVEIDERLVDYINKVADRYGLNVEAEIHDLQKDIGKYRGKYNTFVTDPVETLPGITLFLSRCVSSLKGKGSAGYFGLTTLEASISKWYEIQRIIHDMGFVITDIRRKFNVYPNDGKNFFSFQNKLPIVKKLGFISSDYSWYKSSLYRIEAVKTPEPLIKGDEMLGAMLYHDEESWATPEEDNS